MTNNDLMYFRSRSITIGVTEIIRELMSQTPKLAKEKKYARFNKPDKNSPKLQKIIYISLREWELNGKQVPEGYSYCGTEKRYTKVKGTRLPLLETNKRKRNFWESPEESELRPI